MVNLSRLEEIKDLRTVWPHEALDGLCSAFSEMKQQSLDRCRDSQICQCEFREEAKQ